MGRKPTTPGAIPRFRVRRRGKVTYYFYDHGLGPDGKRVEEPLGRDRGLALARWAELERASNVPAPAIVTFRHVAEHYRREVIPTKAVRTQADNERELTKLLAFFDDPPAPLEAIGPGDVGDYLDWRKDAPVRAAREKALLSHVWNFARRKRYTEKPNPCAGIRAEGSKGRDAYLEDEDYRAIWQAASPLVRDAMDLAYLTGQRPADVLRMSEDDVSSDALSVAQGKTGTRVRIALVGTLAALLDRIRKRKAGYRHQSRRLVVNGQGVPVGVNALSRHWKAACEAAGVQGYQFRDLRAKAATDTEEAAGSLRAAQRQLGHKSARMTEHYTRNRRGAKVMPTRELRKTPAIAEKQETQSEAENMEAWVGIEPAYADLQSGRSDAENKGKD